MLSTLIGIGKGLVQNGINLAGGMLTNEIDRKHQLEMLKRQQDFQARENQIMRNREDNAIFRQQQDLIKSGINPLIAGSLGGASSALGGGISLANPPSLSNAFSNFASGAAAGAQANDTLAKQAKEITKLDSEIKSIEENTTTNIMSRDEMLQRIENLKGEEKLLAERLVTEINSHKQQSQDLLNSQLQHTLLGDQHSMNLKELENLSNQLKRQEFEQKYLWDLEKIQSELANDISSEQLQAIKDGYLKVRAEKDMLEWQLDDSKKLQKLLDNIGFDNNDRLDRIVQLVIRIIAGKRGY